MYASPGTLLEMHKIIKELDDQQVSMLKLLARRYQTAQWTAAWQRKLSDWDCPVHTANMNVNVDVPGHSMPGIEILNQMQKIRLQLNVQSCYAPSHISRPRQPLQYTHACTISHECSMKRHANGQACTISYACMSIHVCAGCRRGTLSSRRRTVSCRRTPCPTSSGQSQARRTWQAHFPDDQTI